MRHKYALLTTVCGRRRICGKTDAGWSQRGVHFVSIHRVKLSFIPLLERSATIVGENNAKPTDRSYLLKMGNAAIRKIPEDLTKCSEAQLRVMINSVIINNPWNEDDDQTEEDSLMETVNIMKEKGYRPITPVEYIEELKRQRKENPKTQQGIKVWIPINDHSTNSWASESKERRGSDSDGSKNEERSSKSTPEYQSTCSLSIKCRSDGSKSSGDSSPVLHQVRLPLSREDAASEVLRSGCSAATISEISEDDVPTEEWPTNGGRRARHTYSHHAQCM